MYSEYLEGFFLQTLISCRTYAMGRLFIQEISVLSAGAHPPYRFASVHFLFPSGGCIRILEASIENDVTSNKVDYG